MRFDKAYCTQLEGFVTPYLARELYFDEGSEYYQVKLHFLCPSIIDCKAELIGVNIYKEKKNKKALHFRSNSEHTCARYSTKNSQKPSGSKNGDEEGFKVTKYPSEFLLERPKGKKANPAIEVEEFEETSDITLSDFSNNPAPNNRKSILRTSCLDHLVDCYLNGDENELKKQPLTISSKTKSFFNFFKKVKFYHDEEGLIYFGEIKEIKKYGKNYKISFKDRPTLNGKNLPVSIYIENNLIENYRKNKMFRIQIEELISAEKSVQCFFVGAYPEPTEVGTEEKFEVLQVKITNLDHISFAFS